MEWAATEVKAKVVNISLGGQDSPEIDPLEEAVNRLTAQTGTLFVIAAGNSGPERGHRRFAGQRGRRADGRCGRQGERVGLLLQPRTADR